MSQELSNKLGIKIRNIKIRRKLPYSQLRISCKKTINAKPINLGTNKTCYKKNNGGKNLSHLMILVKQRLDPN